MSRRASARRPGPGRAKPWFGSDEPRWMRRGLDRRCPASNRRCGDHHDRRRSREMAEPAPSPLGGSQPNLGQPIEIVHYCDVNLVEEDIESTSCACVVVCKRNPFLFTIAEAVQRRTAHFYVGQRGSIAVYNRAVCDDPRGLSGRRGPVIAVKSTARAIKMRIALLPIPCRRQAQLVSWLLPSASSFCRSTSASWNRMPADCGQQGRSAVRPDRISSGTPASGRRDFRQ